MKLPTTPWLVALFFLAGFVVYGSSLDNAFVTWDDTYLIYNNPFVKDISSKTLYGAFSTFDPELYVPLTIISYQIDHAIAGMNPSMFHVTNLILHIVNAILVWRLLERLTEKKALSLFCGALFLVHPLNTEAVVWASARKDVLSTMFFLASILAYLHWRSIEKRTMYILSLALFVCGLLAKVMVLTLPVVLLMIDWLDRRDDGKKLLTEKVPYLALSLVFGMVAIAGKESVLGSTSAWEKFLMAAKSTVFYLQKFILPSDLSVMYPFMDDISVLHPAFWVPLVVVAIIAIVTLVSLRSTRIVAFGMGIYLLTLMPTFTNFMKGGDAYIASDRYAYIPQIGLLFLLTYAADILMRRFSSGTSDAARVIAAVAVLFTAGTMAQTQAATWKNSESLYRHVIQNYPDAIAAHINLAQILREREQGTEALKHLDIAESLRPHARIHTIRASILNKQGKSDDAIAACKVALEVDPNDPIGHYCLGVLYEERGWIDDALKEYSTALAMSPTFVSVQNNIGLIYLQRGQHEEAYVHLSAAADADPFIAEIQYNLGLLEQDRGNHADAVLRFEQTMSIEGERVETLTKLAESYAQLNDKDKTINTLRRILAIDPGNALATRMLDALGITK